MIDAPPERLRPGMTADVEITTASKDSVLLVPIQAVVLRTPDELVPAGRRGAKKSGKKGGAAGDSGAAAKTPERQKKEEIKGVFVMLEDGKVAFRKVTTGLSSDTDYEVAGELKPGEKVVTGPFRVLRTLKPEQRVKVEEPKKKGQGGA
jgi:HlyD family secretion protein